MINYNFLYYIFIGMSTTFQSLTPGVKPLLFSILFGIGNLSKTMVTLKGSQAAYYLVCYIIDVTPFASVFKDCIDNQFVRYVFASGILPKHRKFPFQFHITSQRHREWDYDLFCCFRSIRKADASCQTGNDTGLRILNSAERHSHLFSYPAYRKSRTYCLFFHIPHHTYPSD